MEKMEELFSNIVGQEKVKNRLLFELEGFKYNRYLENLMFISASGNGKTMFSLALANGIYKIKKENGIDCKIISLNGSDLQKVGDFFEQLFLPIIDNNHVVCFIDEFQGISNEFCNALLTILAPNKERINHYNHNGSDCVFDAKKITWITATSEPQKIFKPLESRFDRIFLEDPSLSDLARIISKNTEFQVENEALESLASYSRGEGRNAFMLSQKVTSYCRQFQKIVFTKEDVKNLTNVLNIYKNGVNQTELEILRHLSHGPCSLGQLAAKTGLTRPAQQKNEFWLQRLNYMTIEGKRKITGLGVQYIHNLENSLTS